MWHEIGEIVWWLALAALIGFIVGYLLGRLSGGGHHHHHHDHDHDHDHDHHHGHEHLASSPDMPERDDTAWDSALAAVPPPPDGPAAESEDATSEVGPSPEEAVEKGTTDAGAVVAPAPISAKPFSETGNIEEIQGLGPVYGAKLRAVNIATIRRLLAIGQTADGRQKIATQTGIHISMILTWVNHADLLRVPGLNPQYAEILEAAGVNSPLALARRNASSLTATLTRVNAERHLVPEVPEEDTVAAWIAAAAGIKKVVTH